MEKDIFLHFQMMYLSLNFDKLLVQVNMLSQQIQIINQKLSPSINQKLVWKKKDITSSNATHIAF